LVFSSNLFLFVFLPLTLAGYYLIRRELRNGFLLAMSLLFYAVGEPSFVWVMIGSIATNYLLGLLLNRTRDSGKLLRRLSLAVAVIIDLSILFMYKYYDFAVTNINGLFSANIPLRHIALPIGISFFTFQGMSYILDVFMGKAKVQKNPLYVALYIALFPQLIAGPIVRYVDVESEIATRRENLDDFSAGIQRFTIGLAKKIILSNTFALPADQAFGMPLESLGPGIAWLGILAYAMQIYFDFSGYSDMAIGLGRMFSFHFLENFDYPYTATNVTSFWRKWHISLSTWFRDYVYIPLGGNRRGNIYLHLLIVFFLTGIWHGASWNFILWGMWHGLFLIVERAFRRHHPSVHVPKPVKWLYTMLVILIGWVLFRAPDLSSAYLYIRAMLFMGGTDNLTTAFCVSEYWVVFLVGIIAATPILPMLKKLCRNYQSWRWVLQAVSVASTILLLLASIGFSAVTTYNPFIYFNF